MIRLLAVAALAASAPAFGAAEAGRGRAQGHGHASRHKQVRHAHAAHSHASHHRSHADVVNSEGTALLQNEHAKAKAGKHGDSHRQQHGRHSKTDETTDDKLDDSETLSEYDTSAEDERLGQESESAPEQDESVQGQGEDLLQETEGLRAGSHDEDDQGDAENADSAPRRRLDKEPEAEGSTAEKDEQEQADVDNTDVNSDEPEHDSDEDGHGDHDDHTEAGGSADSKSASLASARAAKKHQHGSGTTRKAQSKSSRRGHHAQAHVRKHTHKKGSSSLVQERGKKNKKTRQTHAHRAQKHSTQTRKHAQHAGRSQKQKHTAHKTKTKAQHQIHARKAETHSNAHKQTQRGLGDGVAITQTKTALDEAINQADEASGSGPHRTINQSGSESPPEDGSHISEEQRILNAAMGPTPQELGAWVTPEQKRREEGIMFGMALGVTLIGFVFVIYFGCVKFGMTPLQSSPFWARESISAQEQADALKEQMEDLRQQIGMTRDEIIARKYGLDLQEGPNGTRSLTVAQIQQLGLNTKTVGHGDTTSASLGGKLTANKGLSRLTEYRNEKGIVLDDSNTTKMAQKKRKDEAAQHALKVELDESDEDID